MIAKHPGECRPHEYQDRVYGPGFRVMNPVKVERDRPSAWRCTVCAPLKEPGKKRGGVHYQSDLIVKRK